MKRVLIFIVLKIGEACLAAVGYAVLWGIGYGFICAIGNVEELNTWAEYYILVPMFSTVPLVGLCLLVACCIGFYHLIKANWKKAGELANK